MHLVLYLSQKEPTDFAEEAVFTTPKIPEALRFGLLMADNRPSAPWISPLLQIIPSSKEETLILMLLPRSGVESSPDVSAS